MGKVSDADAKAIAERAAGLSRPRIARAGREIALSDKPVKKIPVNPGERMVGSKQSNLVQARRGGLEPTEKPLDLPRAMWREWSEKVPAEAKPSASKQQAPASPPKAPGGQKPPRAPNFTQRIGVPKTKPKPEIPAPVVKKLTMAQKYPGVFTQKGALDLTEAERDAIIAQHEKARSTVVDHSSEATNVKSATSKSRSLKASITSKNPKFEGNYWWEPPHGGAEGFGTGGNSSGTSINYTK